MKGVTFDQLVALPLLQHYEKAFRKATGVSLKLLPPDEKMRSANLRQSENPFCAFMGSTPAGCEACLETQRRIEQSSTSKLIPQQAHCYAGLTDVAIPVIIAGRHVATLLSGQIFPREPTQRDFEMMVKKIGGSAGKEWKKMARKAYFETPVVPPETLDAVIQLLTMFAQHLADDISRHVLTVRKDLEPDAVSSAKEFIHSHSGESLTLDRVLQHVHVSRFHFCKIFKKTTGVTFTEYMARVRVEKAKTLLLDPGLRVSEVAFSAGFGSIPQFNCVFKRFVGVSPTEYRGRQGRSPQSDDGRQTNRANGRGSAPKLSFPSAEKAATPGNVIRAASFQREEDRPALPANVIRHALNHYSRRAARA